MEHFKHFFEGRKILIATKHQKEMVIGPLLVKNLGLSVWVPDHFDTDEFGTFTGEIERGNNPIAALRNKCLKAMEDVGYDLCIASEGSFGPHPNWYFLPADDELVMLIDHRNGLELMAREISTDTNFSSEKIFLWHNLEDFANRINFPSHALILRNNQKPNEQIVKGIIDWKQLRNVFEKMKQSSGSVTVETDMRAMFNPTRMKVIEKATLNLIDLIKNCCPSCNTPGFGISEIIPGLPCEQCSHPTQSPLAAIYSCNKCKFTAEKKFPQDKKFQDPMFCDFCNP